MNKWLGCGRLTADPEVHRTTGLNPIVVSIYTVAIDRSYKREGQPNADFIRCKALGKNGEFAEKWLKKGTKIIVEGRIETGSYVNRDGQKVYTTDVMVERQEFAESKASSARNDSDSVVPDTDITNTNNFVGDIEIPDGLPEEEQLPW